MKRKNDNAPPTRIYTYGLPLGCTKNAELVETQMRLAHRYQNDLIAIERARRAAARAILTEAGGEAAALDTQLEDLTGELAVLQAGVRGLRAEKRSRVAMPVGVQERIRVLRAAIKAARAARKLARKELAQNADVKAQLASCNDRAADMVRRHRAACGVYWGTYLLVEAAVDAARKQPMDPHFKRWTGDARVGVQIQGGLAVGELGADTRLRIDETWPHPDGKHVGLVQIRIGSEGRAPVWASFPLRLHRPLPEDAVIKWAWVQRRRIGTRYRWELQIVLEARSFVVLPRQLGPTCAIDLGWRKRGEDGLRIGFLVDEHGRSEELALPAAIRAKLEHADSLRAIRDRNFNAMRAELAAWLITTRAECEARLTSVPNVPPALAEQLGYLHAWKVPARLTRVVWAWKAQRFEGDEVIFEKLEAWRKQERHLYQWEANERTKTLLRRRETYRILAKRIADQYATIVIEDLDLRDFAKRAAIDETEAAPEPRYQRFVAALSEFRDALRHAASKTGASIVKVLPQYTTRACASCGALCNWNQGKHLTHVCEHCGATWDQDANAGRNLLDAYLANGPAPAHSRKLLDASSYTF